MGDEKKRIKALKKEADIYIISRDYVIWLCKLLMIAVFKQNKRFPFDCLVIDESSSFKNQAAKRFRQMIKFIPRFKRVVILTGTPAPNGYMDLWSQIYFLDEGERLGKNITSYRTTFFHPIIVVGNVVYKYGLNDGADKVINNRIKDICMSMKAEDYLTLPDYINNVIHVKLSPELKAEYKEFEREKILELNDYEGNESIIAVSSAAAVMNKLMQFANGSVYDEYKEVHQIHDLKLEALKELIESLNGEPALIAYSFQFDREKIKSVLREYKPRELKGKQDVDDWNNGKIQVLIAHPASVGHGLNLQRGGHNIVWYGLTWSLELYVQFNARLYRQGQQAKSVFIHHIITDGTFDEKAYAALQAKESVQSAFLGMLKQK
jgi:SNF2 family DNA or RNA helicase